jgi:hypothetical protein
MERTAVATDQAARQRGGPTLFFGDGRTRPIAAATDLLRYLPVDKRHHYRDGYSMAETAKAWVEACGRVPSTVVALVGTDVLDVAYFEYPTKVWGGGISMTDVMALVPNGAVAVEGKARETFGEYVWQWLSKEKRKDKPSPSHRMRQIERYAEAFRLKPNQLFEIRYQLLHRTLSAALAARKHRLERAWMVVQSFARLDCDNHMGNRSDFDRYRSAVGDSPVIAGVEVRLGWVDDQDRVLRRPD